MTHREDPRFRGEDTPDLGKDSVQMPAAATWIDRPDALAAAAARWQIRAADAALDTEFVFERTYRPRLGIVQIAVAGEIALVDAVRIPDLSALGPLLADPARRKLLHSGSGDLPILRRAGGAPLARPVRHADRGGVRRASGRRCPTRRW